MNLNYQVSHISDSQPNKEFDLLPENVRDNPHMFLGWREGLLWALLNPRLIEQFERDTGADIDIDIAIDGRGLGVFISPQHGLQVEELALFFDWFNRTIWGA